MRRNSLLLAVFSCVLAHGCAPTARLTIERLAPPLADVGGIKEVAVLPFGDSTPGSPWGREVAGHLASVVINTGRYRVLDAERVKEILRKKGIAYDARLEAGTLRAIGSALGVDAILYGTLENFQCDEEITQVRLRERVWTGEYERDGRGNVVTDAGKGDEAVPRRRLEKKMVEKNHLRRHAVLDVRFNMADAFVGNVICSEEESESGSWEGTGEAEIAQLPSRDVIFELLLDRAVKKFVRHIASHPVQEERLLEYGAFHSTRLGVELAKNNLWEEAMEKWIQAIKAKPDDPAAYYNLGVGFEQKGLFNLAYKSYQNALSRNPHSKRYIKAVAKIQKLIKDLQ